ncbi:MAG: sensor histidine kinase [Gemmatimonadota bacterium]
MSDPMPIAAGAELADVIFQAAITAGLAGFALVLYRRVRERWLAWWAAAWAVYLVRLGAMLAFLATGNLTWLFWHQVATGWVALTILWAALVFSRGTVWRHRYASFALVPLIGAWFAVAYLDRFLLVAIPMVALISGATLWTAWVFWRHGRRTDSGGARFVAVAFLFWGLHHLDYPFLRARGAWAPWGYYLDILFELAVGVGFGLMVLSDLATRLAGRTDDLARLSGLMVRQHEAERLRLSRDLHDETAQTLSAIKLEVGLLRESDGTVAVERLDRVLQLVDAGIGGIRRVMNDLRPALLDDVGLLSAIRSLAEDVRHRGAIVVETDLPERAPSLSPDAELALFRAAQEALVNTLRHAAASRVVLRICAEENALQLSVTDNGRGFPPGRDLATFEREGHLGLAGMRERIAGLGGTVRVNGTHGVRVVVTVPFASETVQQREGEV